MRKIYCLLAAIMICSFIHAQIAITEVYYDTPYIERQNLNTRAHLGEFIELFNYTTKDIDISGWKLSDNTGSYYFPQGTIITSGDYMIVAYTVHQEDYFFGLFPNEEDGNENKVLYQNSIVMNNYRDWITLSTKNLADEKLRQYYTISKVAWSCGGINSIPCNRNPIDPNTFGDETSQGPYNTNFDYYVPSLQKMQNQSLEDVNQTLSNYAFTATPFGLNFTPELMDMDDIGHVKNILLVNYYCLTNDERVDAILNMSCDINIPIISTSSVSDTYIEEQCFNFDAAGNQESNNLCSSDGDDSDSTGGNQGDIFNDDLTYNLVEIANRIHIVPNPTSGLITISWDNDISNIISQINIVPMTGSSLVIPVNFSSNSNSATSNLSAYSNGFYVVRFTLDSGEVVTKTIIKI